jgi:hypothetical protein
MRNGWKLYDPEVKGNFLNVRSLADSAVWRFLVLAPGERLGLSGKSPFPGCLAMTGKPQDLPFDYKK